MVLDRLLAFIGDIRILGVRMAFVGNISKDAEVSPKSLRVISGIILQEVRNIFLIFRLLQKRFFFSEYYLCSV